MDHSKDTEAATLFAKELAYSGKSYDQIEQELKSQRLTENVLKTALKKSDQFIAEYQIAKQEKSKVLVTLVIGASVFMLGLTITLFSQGILAYGALIGGASIAVKSFMAYQKPLEDFAPKYRRFSRRF
ncbi:MAG: hypothetical protein AAF847_17065 [Bacteroidota bacterium]